jgi:hypothetical protein
LLAKGKAKKQSPSGLRAALETLSAQYGIPVRKAKKRG